MSSLCRNLTRNPLAAVTRLILVLAAMLALPLGAHAQVLTPEIERGLTWLQAQVQTDGTVINETGAMAEELQVRCEVNTTLRTFGRTSRLPWCVMGTVTRTEILARNGSMLPAAYWLSDGGVVPDAGFASSNIIDTSWALESSSTTTAQLTGAIAYLFSYQAASGGFPATSGSPETVAATSLIGRELSHHKGLLTGSQPGQLAAAAAWVSAQAQSVGVWSSLYETAVAHLFLAVESPDAARDAVTYEYLVAQQLPDGSWNDDPFLTALILRAAGTRSLPKTVDSGFKLRVIDAVTRAPIQAAGVSGGPYTATNASGFASVLVAPTANLAVTVSKSGYQSKTLSVAIAAGTVADLGEIELQPLATSVLISGDIVDEVTLQPIPNVYIYVYVDGVYSRFLSSDANGHYEGNLTQGGHCRIDYSVYGYISAYAEFDATLGNSYQIDTRLAAKANNSDGGFRGTVTDAATGSPLGNVQVYWRSTSSATKLVYTAADGTYAMTGLVREQGDLSFNLGGYLGKKASGVIPGNPISVADVALDKGAALPTSGALSGTVRDNTTKTTLPGVRIDLIDKATTTTVAVLTSDAGGQFAASGLPFKTYKYVASLSGYLSLTGEFQLTNYAALLDLSLGLQRAIGSVTGTVVDKASGQPIAGATASIGALQAVSDAAGAFSLSNLDPGIYTLTISATGYSGSSLSASVIGGHLTDIGKVELMPGAASPTAAEIIGTVTSKATGAPIAGAAVSVYLTPIGATTDAAGAFSLQNVALGERQVRVVAPGYLPATYRMTFASPTRYRLDAALTPVDANAVSIAVAADATSYGAYASGKVTTRFTVSSGVSAQYGYLEYAVFDQTGRIVKTLPEPGSTATGLVWLHSTAAPYDMPFSTGNLPPGTYRVEVSLYDSNAGARSNRVLLSVSSAEFSIVPIRSIPAITVTPLPTYANVGVPTPSGYRLEVINKSNVLVEFDIDLRLLGPAATTTASVAQHVSVRPDEPFKSLDVSAGSVTFTPHGQYQAAGEVTGIDPPAVTVGTITVLPSIRIEARKKIVPGVIPPDADHRLRIDIRIKGVEQ